MIDELPTIFAGIREVDIASAMRAFKEIEVDADVALIEEGDLDASLVLVLRGSLEVVTGDTRLGVAKSGDIVGEMALFAGGVRTATVRSMTPARLLLLDMDGYLRLRSYDSPVAVVLEEHALAQLIDRLRRTSGRISDLAQGTLAEHITPSPGFFGRVAAAFGSGGFFAPSAVDAAEVLAKSSLFAGAKADTLAMLAARFTQIGARQGHFICTEGEPGDSMYIVASGGVDVLVETENDHVEYLATLEPGEAFGMGSLVQQSHRRMASCVAKERSTLLQLNRLAFAEVAHAADACGATLRVAMIRALSDQLAYANGQLTLLDLKQKSDIGALLRAGAGVEAHGGYLSRGGDPRDKDLPDYLRGV